jgi:hypothetical protein
MIARLVIRLAVLFRIEGIKAVIFSSEPVSDCSEIIVSPAFVVPE